MAARSVEKQTARLREPKSNGAIEGYFWYLAMVKDVAEDPVFRVHVVRGHATLYFCSYIDQNSN